MPACSRWIACLLLAGCLAAPVLAAETVPDANRQAAIKWICDAINDPDDLPVALAGLKSVNDPRLLPVFAKLATSDDKEIRLMATALIADVGGKQAAPALTQRLKTDPSMVIRGEALIHLAKLDAVTDADLVAATQLPDQGVQVIAARALADREKANLAKELLTKLADSRDIDTEVFARMTLLDLGDTGQIPHLRKIIVAPDTSPDLLVRMLNQVRDDKIAKALPVARYLAKPPHLMPVRLRAYWAIAELADAPAEELAAAIREDQTRKDESPSLMLQLNILRMLAERENVANYLREFGVAKDSLGPVARFELARQSDDAKLTAAVQAVIDEGHPVVIEYVLNRFRQDVEAGKKQRAEQYVQPLLAYLASLELTRDRLTSAHDRGAVIVELLANHGSQTAVGGLKTLLKGTQNTPMRQLVAGALYRSTNSIAVDLVRPLLDSAYSELYTYAALVCARHDVKAAIPVLLKIQGNERTSRPDVLVLANWYLIELSGMATPSVEAIVAGIE